MALLVRGTPDNQARAGIYLPYDIWAAAHLGVWVESPIVFTCPPIVSIEGFPTLGVSVEDLSSAELSLQLQSYYLLADLTYTPLPIPSFSHQVFIVDVDTFPTINIEFTGCE